MDDTASREQSLGELMSAAGLGAAIEATSIDTPSSDLSHVRISELSTDSRTARAGSCFVALRGGKQDGHAFIDEAIRRGATAVISEADVTAPSVPRGVASVRVRDVRTALARLAAAFYEFAPGQRFSGMTLIGVTGTNGKSTTCRFIQSILQQAGCPTALMGTVEYDLVGERRAAPWTTPPPVELYASLYRAASAGARHAVMEVSSHSLAQSRCAAGRFAVGVFTNLTGDHLDYHGTEEAYGLAKKRLFDGLDGDATAVVNADDRWSERMVSDCAGRVWRYGMNAPADVAARIDGLTLDGSRFEVQTPRGAATVRLGMAGRHNVYNAMAAAGAATAVGVDLAAVGRGLEAVKLVRGRLQRVDDGSRGIAVLVDYAHTDDALTNVLGALRPLTAGRLICVFGCGGDRDRTKRPRMARAAAAADVVVVTSDNPRGEEPMAIIEEICSGFEATDRDRVVVEPDRRRAIGLAIERADAGDAVLIAGKGHEDYQIVGEVRHHFDDVEEAVAALAQLERVVA